MSAASLAIIGDYVPFGISQALGRRTGSNSLDNTLRVAHRVPTEWVLADIRVHAVADGFGHGLVHLWAEDGTLLGTASQSAQVRLRTDEVPMQPEPEIATPERRA
jgi:acyl-CoA thioesterase